LSFIGKFAAVGQGGSGKTRAIAEIANYLAEQPLYPWNEESNLSGTLTVTPYSVSIPAANRRPNDPPNSKRIIIADNPGQNSLELVRQSVAKSGADYLGIIIFADGLGWNFREVGLIHAESIAQFLKTENLPIVLLTSKADMVLRFQQTSLLPDIAHYIYTIVQQISNGTISNVPYFDRVRNQQQSFKFQILEGGWLPFTQLEQVIVNALDKEFFQSDGFTIMNRRLFVRSLLLGYCDYYRSEFPEYIRQYPIFNAIDENLLNALNYHRPTAFETGTPWKVLGSQSRSGFSHIIKNEPPFRYDAFDPESILYVLRNYCLGTQSHHIELEGLIRQKANEYGWKFISSAYTDSITRIGIEKSVNCIRNLVAEVESRTEKKSIDSAVDWTKW
jgi:hypothetical protein